MDDGQFASSPNGPFELRYYPPGAAGGGRDYGRAFIALATFLSPTGNRLDYAVSNDMLSKAEINREIDRLIGELDNLRHKIDPFIKKHPDIKQG